jgi:hypothetical protein
MSNIWMIYKAGLMCPPPCGGPVVTRRQGSGCWEKLCLACGEKTRYEISTSEVGPQVLSRLRRRFGYDAHE